VARVTLETPALLVVVVQTQVASEALQAEIDHSLFGFRLKRDLRAEVEILPKASTLRFEHDFEEPLHGLDVHTEELEFTLKHGKHVGEDLGELCFPFSNQFTRALYVLPDGRKYKFGVDGAVPFD
jgi:hypothetical protein